MVPPPETGAEPARLQHPAWQPTPAQVRAARKQAWISLAALALLACACLVSFAWFSGWRP